MRILVVWLLTVVWLTVFWWIVVLSCDLSITWLLVICWWSPVFCWLMMLDRLESSGVLVVVETRSLLGALVVALVRELPDEGRELPELLLVE